MQVASAAAVPDLALIDGAPGMLDREVSHACMLWKSAVRNKREAVEIERTEQEFHALRERRSAKCCCFCWCKG